MRVQLTAFGLMAFVAGCATTDSSSGQDVTVEEIVRAKPSLVSIVYSGEHARVLRVSLPPGADLPAHEGRRRLIYSLSDYTIEWREGDGPVETKKWTTGDVHVHESLAHRVRNIGSTVVDYLVFERLDSTLPNSPSVNRDHDGPVVSYADSYFRVRKVILEPKAAMNAHSGTHRAIYSLTDYTVSWNADGKVSEKAWSRGQAHWHAPGEHAVENTGDTTAAWIVVEFLR